MADLLSIHDDIKLYTTSDKFYLEPTINPTEILVIDRVTGEAVVKEFGSVKIPIPANAYRPVCGFLGSIKLLSGLYLVVAKYRILMGKLNGHDIYQLAGADIIPYARSNTHLTNKQIEDNNTYERMVRLALDTPGMYFSYSYDLTHCLQRLHSVTPDFHRMSITNRADPRFLWNGFLLRDFSHHQYSRFTLPLIQGFVSINNVTVNGHQLTWSLVSRRCVDRAGTRFFMRGVDAQGNVANFVETEQIIERGGEKSSFVQTRGSIPLFWSQYPDIKYKPAMQLAHEDHVAAYTKHLRDQQQRYGNQVLVNLIDQHGKEEALERGFRAAVAAAALPGVRYEPFDFHAECRSMRYYRLNIDQHGKEEALERGFRAAVAAAALPGVRYEPFDFHAECRSMRYYRLNIDQHGKEEALERGFRAAVAAAALPGVRYEPFDFHAECRSMRYYRLNIDQHGKEEALERGFRAAVAAAALPGVRYEPFDFHAECRSMRYYRLNVLIDRIAHEQTEFGYFLSRGGTVLLRQSGVFRTNCVDCLDRTNVVQSLLARLQLNAALRVLAVTSSDDEKHPYLDKLFNNVWADHADTISTQYSGTGALKTDYTRTGKRTHLGLIRDGINSLTRYYKNNFSDGFRQDSIDLFLGKYVIVDGEGNTLPCPLRRDRDWKYITFPSVLLVAMSMFCASATLPQRYSSEVLLYLMFWGAAVTATLTFIFRHGKEFVDWPRLDAGGLAAARSLPPPQSL